MNTIDSGFRAWYGSAGRLEEPKASREDRDVRSGPIRQAEGESGGEAPAKLEQSSYKVTRHAHIKVAACRCMSWLCVKCAAVLGATLRAAMVAKADLIRKPKLFTLTVDPKMFASPEAAYDHVTSNRYIPRLLRLLGVKRAFRVLEFQINGWPHWHILLDVADLPGSFLDLKRVWRLYLHKWKIGGCKLSPKSFRFTSPIHAIMYITKYLTKFPRQGYPDWVINRKKKIRFYAAYGLGPLRYHGQSKKEPDEQPKKHRRKRRSLPVRLAACGYFSNIFSPAGADSKTGQEKYIFYGKVCVSPQMLLFQGSFCNNRVRFYKAPLGYDEKGNPYKTKDGVTKTGVYMETDYSSVFEAIKSLSAELISCGIPFQMISDIKSTMDWQEERKILDMLREEELEEREAWRQAMAAG